MSVLITNIQRFCLHDGPGIRTTVFLKGCNLNCPWCCNPENISSYIQNYYDQEKCTAENGVCICGECFFADRINSAEKLAMLSEDDIKRCFPKALGSYGKFYETQELVTELLKDKEYFRNGGGVTFSGGEPLLQFDNLIPVIDELHNNNINICVETALFVDDSIIKKSLEYIDYYVVDLKVLDRGECKKILDVDIDKYISNIELLINNNKRISLRHPVISGYTDSDLNKISIKEFVNKYKGKIIDYTELDEHHLGDRKRKSLG